MPMLVIEERRLEVPGLGKRKSLLELGPKRITIATRERLRSAYGFECVVCSCKADKVSGIWRGTCWIDRQELPFRIEESFQE